MEKLVNGDIREQVRTITDHAQETPLDQRHLPPTFVGKLSRYAIGVDPVEPPKLFKIWSARLLPTEPPKPAYGKSYYSLLKIAKDMENDPATSAAEVEKYKNSYDYQLARNHHLWYARCTYL